jgi:DNA-binding CsgD family transcriptional regulator
MGMGLTISRSIVQQAIKRDQSARYQEAQMEDLSNRYESLTPRQREVMASVVSGLLNKQVAAELGISEITVKVKRGQVMHNLGESNRTLRDGSPGGGTVPGTSCQATIASSLRDISQQALAECFSRCLKARPVGTT